MKKEALENLFRKYYNEAKLYVVTLCHDLSLAEDIVSDSFYKAFTKIDEEKESFKFWLFKVCRNAYFDHLKKTKRLSELDDNLGRDDDLAARVIKNEEYQSLYRAISLLKPNYREIILLYYFDELSVSEIAGITDQTVENVKVQMYRARMKLKDILED